MQHKGVTQSCLSSKHLIYLWQSFMDLLQYKYILISKFALTKVQKYSNGIFSEAIKCKCKNVKCKCNNETKDVSLCIPLMT